MEVANVLFHVGYYCQCTFSYCKESASVLFHIV